MNEQVRTSYIANTSLAVYNVSDTAICISSLFVDLGTRGRHGSPRQSPPPQRQPSALCHRHTLSWDGKLRHAWTVLGYLTAELAPWARRGKVLPRQSPRSGEVEEANVMIQIVRNRTVFITSPPKVVCFLILGHRRAAEPPGTPSLACLRWPPAARPSGQGGPSLGRFTSPSGAARAGKRQKEPLSALRAHIKAQHKIIYHGERQGRLTALGGPGPC
jgi:hypothetical protein